MVVDPDDCFWGDGNPDPSDADLFSLHRSRRLGAQCSGLLGMGHHQLRFLDRNRTRRNIDLGHPFPYPPKVAHLHQPLG